MSGTLPPLQDRVSPSPPARGAPVAGGKLLAWCAGLLLALLPLAPVLQRAWRPVFGWPSAHAAAAFLGTPCVAEADAYLLPHPRLAVRVTPACSAAGFFGLLVALGLAHAATGPRAGRGRRAALALAAAYATVLAANTARIVLGWPSGLWARRALPPAFHDSVHLAVGAAVFALALFVYHALLLRCTTPGPAPAAPTTEDPSHDR